ncbi:protein SPIRRIG-like [Musa acuminata AAA Group]|uniref:protein SPIRRIG-like n=1 Tax=Musa acuminata AAA Group TaxID=214697 RepID=UPI0031DAE540
MQSLRGYHLLALILHRRMSLFDMHSLDIFFHIAACEASFTEPVRLQAKMGTSFPAGTSPEASIEDLSLPKFSDDICSVDSHGDLDEYSVQKDSISHFSELENTGLSEANSDCIVLSNADMVEHVLLDWTLWVRAPVPIQIALLGFLECMVSMHWYRHHNLTILHHINLVQHLLVTLQCGDVEVVVLEKLVVLLGVILEDGFLASELELVVRFVLMTFDPPELTPQDQIVRVGKHVIVRNMLLEMLIDLQVTINAEELLEQWHKTVSSKLIAFFLDEAVHPTSMRWIMTLLGVCLSSSPTFSFKFQSSGSYHGLSRVLPSFHDSPEIYYILFCLIFGKAVYPRVPEVRMLDFFSLLPNDGNYGELKFLDLLEILIAMAKATYDRFSMQSMIANQDGNMSHFNGSLVAKLVEATTDVAGDLRGEALLHKTYASCLMSGMTGAPIAATSILRFMVDLAKTCPPFSAVCRRTEFLESCVDLYFSCVRAYCALKMAKNLTTVAPEEKNIDVDAKDSQNMFCSEPLENVQSVKISVSTRSFPHEQKTISSGDIQGSPNYPLGNADVMQGSPNYPSGDAEVGGDATNLNPKISVSGEGGETETESLDEQSFRHVSLTSNVPDIEHLDSNGTQIPIQPTDSLSSASMSVPCSLALSERSNLKDAATPSTSPIPALTSWIGNTSSESDAKAKLTAAPSLRSFSLNEFDSSPDIRTLHESSATSMFFLINPKLLLEIDNSGYGGGPCSAGAAATLDFIAEVLADVVSEQLKATQSVENILESVPLYVDVESTLVFQGLCLSRLMNFLERRLLHDDEEDDKKLDKNCWSVNLDSLCWMIVDHLYMGSFPEPVGVIRTLEFVLSMLQLANKDGHVEDAVPAGKGILSIARGGKQLEAYINAILKNANHIIMYYFLPSFLKSIGEDDLLLSLGFQSQTGKGLPFKELQDESSVDICMILQLLIANKQLILCHSNLDTYLICCLCVNLIAILHDKRSAAQNLAVDIIKYLLVRRHSALEDLLVSKPNQGHTLDVLHGGLDKLLTGRPSSFFYWLQSSEQTINKVLEQCSSIMWLQYVAGLAKFPRVRIMGMEGCRKGKISRKAQEATKLDIKHWEQIYE